MWTHVGRAGFAGGNARSCAIPALSSSGAKCQNQLLTFILSLIPRPRLCRSVCQQPQAHEFRSCQRACGPAREGRLSGLHVVPLSLDVFRVGKLAAIQCLGAQEAAVMRLPPDYFLSSGPPPLHLLVSTLQQLPLATSEADTKMYTQVQLVRSPATSVAPPDLSVIVQVRVSDEGSHRRVCL